MLCSFFLTKNFFKKGKNQSFFDSFFERGSSLFKGFAVRGTKNYGMRKFMRNSLRRVQQNLSYLLYVHELF
jgi:hypothetical protein